MNFLQAWEYEVVPLLAAVGRLASVAAVVVVVVVVVVAAAGHTRYCIASKMFPSGGFLVVRPSEVVVEVSRTTVEWY